MSYSICISCGKRRFAKRNGVKVIEYFDVSHKEAYRIWSADLFECPNCASRAVSGFSPRPTDEQFQPDFATNLQKAKESEFTVEFD